MLLWLVSPGCIQSIRNVPENTWPWQAKCLCFCCPEVQHENITFIDVLSRGNVFQVVMLPQYLNRVILQMFPLKPKGLDRDFCLGTSRELEAFPGPGAAGAVRGAAGGGGCPCGRRAGLCARVSTAVSVSQGTAVCRRVPRAVMC